LAITAGGRSGRLATSVKNRDPLRLREQRRDQGPGVEEAVLVGVVLDADEREAAFVCHPHELAVPVQRVRVRDDRDPHL
jgi:hypothetical protein